MKRGDYRGNSSTWSRAHSPTFSAALRSETTCGECSSTDSLVGGCCQICGHADENGAPSGPARGPRGTLPSCEQCGIANSMVEVQRSLCRCQVLTSFLFGCPRLQKTLSPLYCGIGRESARARGRGSARLRCQGFAATRLTRLVRRTGSSIKNKCVRRAPALQHLPSVLTSPSGCTFCRCAAFHSANHFSLSRSILRNTREVSLACVRFSS